MKRDNDLFNELARNSDFLHEVTESESAKLKATLVEMLSDIIHFCGEHGITYMLSGGSCIGAVRHKGFIPWDDDIDLMMPREGVMKMIGLYEDGFFPDSYELTYPSAHKDSPFLFLKVYKKGTHCVEVFNDNSNFPTEISMDIFPLDYAPKNKIHRKLKGYLLNTIKFISTSLFYVQYPSPSFKVFAKLDRRYRMRYMLRLMTGYLFYFFKHKNAVWLFDYLCRHSKNEGFLTIASGRGRFYNETLPTSVYLPVVKVPFEGKMVNIPNGYDVYLTNVYGDYMKMPPVEQRERHFIIDLKV